MFNIKKKVKKSSASEYWSGKKGYAANWYSFCQSEISNRITGDRKQNPWIWALKSSFAELPVPHLLEIGCLSGDMLAGLIETGFGSRGTGIDIAEGAIKIGRQKWGDKIAFHVVDLNNHQLKKQSYSACLSNGVLHHIKNLERCCQAIYDALEPGGVLIASEFTGPRRYQYSRREIDLINEGMAMLPEELQGQAFDPSQLEKKLAKDPSESVRTRDIQPVIEATFDSVITKPYGGNILMRALSRTFFENFDSNNIEHTHALENLIEFDAQVSANEPSHNCFFIARKARAAEIKDGLA